jgi:hypothetical protein
MPDRPNVLHERRRIVDTACPLKQESVSVLQQHNTVLRAQLRDRGLQCAELLTILKRLEPRLEPHEGVIVNAIRKELRLA